MTDYNELIKSILAPVINDWFRLQAANVYTHYYLYYRQATEGEKIAAPIIAENAPSENWELAMLERVSPSWTRQTALEKCFQALKDNPILGE